VPSKPPVIALRNLSKVFIGPRGERVEAVAPLDLVIDDAEDGEFVAVLGPSGCGKSTVLHMISGLTPPTTGEIRLFGEPLGALAGHRTVTVPQKYTCFPWLTALGNVAFGLEILGKGRAERETIATEYLAKVGLGDRLGAYPRELSGGMQQRVAIARTLAMQPKVVLMDEPFGALDAQNRAEMQQLLLTLWEAEKNTVLFITHDITEALLLADRVIVFSPRPARIVEDLRVPFARPRTQELLYDPTFVQATRALRDILHRSPS
jgi:ABC-type nitrate/sulfonate/bicarbonate transport system ATPase subunit